MFRSGAKSAIVNTLYLSASNLFGLLIKIVYVAFLARELGPELYGTYSYALAFYVIFLPLASFGLSGIMVREIGSRLSDTRDVANQFSGVRLILVVATACFYALSCFLLEGASQVLSIHLILIGALVGRTTVLWNESIFAGFERTKESLRLQGIWRTAEALTGVVLLALGASLTTIAWIHVLSWVFQAIAGHKRSQSLLQGYSPLLSREIFLKLVGLSWPIAIAGFLVSWSLQGPIVVFRHVVGGEALGQMALAFQVFGILTVIPASLGVASLPILTRSVERGDRKDDVYLSVTIRIELISSALVGCGVVALAGPLFLAVFGETYIVAADLARYFIWLLAPFSIASTLRAQSISRKRYSDVLVNALVGAGVFTILALVLVENLGAEGVFLSALFGYSMSSVYSGWIYVKELPGEHIRAIISSIVVFAIGAVVAFMTVSLEWYFQLGAGVMVVVVGTMALGVLTKSELELFRNLLFKRP